MFFKKLKKQTLIFLLSFYIIPQFVFAYSDMIIASGKTVGIKLNTDGILVVGSYEVNGHNSLIESGLKNGDIIYQINNKKVYTVEDMVNIISNCNCNNINITYKRNNKLNYTTLNLYEDNGTLKTGLYVKDTIPSI